MTIIELGVDDLRQGVLATGFASGAVAAVIRGDARVRDLWARLVENESEQLPWQAPLIDIARNHHGTGDITVSLGDLFYFQPGQHGYIARKFEIERDTTGSARARPDRFAQGNAHYVIERETIERCADLAETVMMALTPEGQTQATARVAVQRLKYQPHASDFDSLAQLTANSLGRWGRLGAAIDRQRQRATGFLSRKGFADLIGMLSLVPGIGVLVRAFAARIAARDPRERLAEGDTIVERAHVDERYFSALAGARTNVRTEVFANGRWHELPIGLDSIAIFPGRLARRFGIEPTLHRVVHIGNAPATTVDPRSGNVTLLIGAV